MEKLDLLNSDLLDNQFYPLKQINRNSNKVINILISGYTYSTGIVQPLSQVNYSK